MEITRRGFFKVTGIGTTIALEMPAAAEPHRFSAGLYAIQSRVAETIEAIHAERPLSASPSSRFLVSAKNLCRGHRAAGRFNSTSRSNVLARSAVRASAG